MIVKGKVTSKVLDMIKYSIEDTVIQKMKKTVVMVDINPNNLS